MTSINGGLFSAVIHLHDFNLVNSPRQTKAENQWLAPAAAAGNLLPIPPDGISKRFALRSPARNRKRAAA